MRSRMSARVLGRGMVVCLIALLMAGCQAPGEDVERTELQAARERIAKLERRLAQTGTAEPAQEDVGSNPPQWKPRALEWQQRDVPDSVRAEKATFERPEGLLAALAGVLIDLQPGEGGDNAILRLRQRGNRFIGEIAVRDLPDDSVGALQFRATLRKRGGAWRVVLLEERVICRRGGSGQACL